MASIVAGLSSAREGWSVDSTINNQRQVIRQAKHRFHPTSDHLALSNLMRHFCEQRGRYQVDEFCYDVKANPKALYFLKGKIVKYKNVFIQCNFWKFELFEIT